MLQVLRFLRYQFIHYLSSLHIRLKIELTVLLIIFLIFFTEKSADLFSGIAIDYSVSYNDITFFIFLIFKSMVAVGLPLVCTFLLPRQKLIQVLRVYPMDPLNTFFVLFSTYLKYLVFVLILFFPIVLAMLFKFPVILVSLQSISVLIFSVNLALLIHALIDMGASREKMYSLYYASGGLYFLLFYLIQNATAYTYIINGLFDLAFFALLWRKWTQTWQNWDDNLYRTEVVKHRKKSSESKRNRFESGRFRQHVYLALTLKEIYAYIRNANFGRLKIFSTLIYLLILLFGIQFPDEHFLIYVSTVTFIFLWLHYTHQFNEKFAQPDSAFFLKTLPMHYMQIWISKFFAEMVFISPVIVILIFILLFQGTDPSTAFFLISGVFLFAVFILATIISVKLLFYDQPRKAGYAYHFMVTFALVMIYHYYLVGPVIIIFTLIYISYLSYRQFAR